MDKDAGFECFVKASIIFSKAISPYFKQTPINSAGYRRVFKDGSLMMCVTDLKWQDIYLANDCFHQLGKKTNIAMPQFINSEYTPWSILRNIKSTTAQGIKLNQAMNEYGFKTGLFFIYHQREYYEVIGFTAGDLPTDDLYFLQNIPSLKKIILKMREVIATDRLLKKLFNESVFLDNPFNQFDMDKKNAGDLKDELMAPDLKRYYLADQFDRGYLTATEVKYLIALAQGHSCKLIAKQNGVSPRTIEKHLENIRVKHNLSSMDMLYNAVINNPFFRSLV